MIENRKHRRMPGEIYVEGTYVLNDALKEALFLGKDISAGGMLIKTSEPLSSGIIMNIRIYLPTSASPLKVEAKVNRIEKVDPKTSHVGVYFTKISNEEKKEIIKYLVSSLFTIDDLALLSAH